MLHVFGVVLARHLIQFNFFPEHFDHSELSACFDLLDFTLSALAFDLVPG